MDTYHLHTIIDDTLTWLSGSDSLPALLREAMGTGFEGNREENALPYIVLEAGGAYVGTLALESQDGEHSGVFRWCPIVGDVHRFSVAYVLDEQDRYVETTITVL